MSRSHAKQIAATGNTKIIGVKGVFKVKQDISSGRFGKLKFRLVPQGHLVDRALYSFDETNSPAVSLGSVFATVNVAAYENRIGFTMDIPGAYLNAELKEPHVVRFGADPAEEFTNQYRSQVHTPSPRGWYIASHSEKSILRTA